MYHTDTVVRPTGETFEVIVHPAPGARSVIINYPGRGSDINGYNNKYRTLGEYVTQKKLGVFIQMPNIEWPKRDYRKTLIEDMLAVCEYVRKSIPVLLGSEGHFGERSYELCLMGFSAGASGVAGAAHKSGASKILLMAPSTNADKKAVIESLSAFQGELYIAVGKDDEVCGTGPAEQFFKAAENAWLRAIQLLPNCDHQFRGSENGQTMGKAPFWAFGQCDSFPNPKGGPVLY